MAEKEYDEIINLFNGKPTNISFESLNNLRYDEYFIMLINEKFGTNISPFTTKHSKITQFYYELFIKYGKDFFNNAPELFPYKLCEILKFHSSEINDFANKLNIDYYNVRNSAEKYKIKEGMSKENFILFCHSEQFCEFDKNKNIIPNSGHELSLEEKKYIVKYIKSLNVPLCWQTVNIIQKEIINESIIVPTQKESAKKI